MVEVQLYCGCMVKAHKISTIAPWWEGEFATLAPDSPELEELKERHARCKKRTGKKGGGR